MTKSIFLLFVSLFILNTSISADIPKIEPGVSKDLATWRKSQYSDVRYRLNLSLEKMSPTLKGTIEVSLRSKSDRIVLDWRKIKGSEALSKISHVSINNVGLTLKPSDSGNSRQRLPVYEEYSEHLVFTDGVVIGENVIKLDFESPILKSGSAITRYIDNEDGNEYLYSLFVPSDASTAFPVFDQPDLKARFGLTVKSPYDWEVVSNTDLNPGKVPADGVIGSSASEAGSLIEKTAGGSVLREFKETEPISTYVFAFAAGNFEVFSETGFSKELTKFSPERKRLDNDSRDDGTTVVGTAEAPEGSRVYVRESQAGKFKPHAEEVFRLNREAIKYFEDYFDFKFPFPKYDVVLIPEFPFGGMEHAGATFLRERSVIFPSEPTSNDYISRASVIFHEAAHQWFGDTVTMEWFDDLWLKEGFATFMAYKAMDKVLPEYDSWKVFYERTKPGAYATDVTKGTTPIYQEISNLSAAKSAYGNIVYQKAPSFLKQAEFYLGEKDFQEAVRLFLRHSAYGNADWSMLVMAFEATSKKDLSKWADAWVKTPGMPVFKLKIERFAIKTGQLRGSTQVKLVLSQKSTLVEDFTWPQKLEFFYIYEDGKRRNETVTLEKGDAEIEELWGATFQDKESRKSKEDLRPPKFVFPNYQDFGYGIFLLDDASKKYVLENIQTEKDAFLRSMMWGALWDSVRFGELDPAEYIELAIKNIGVETDQTTISSILGRVRTAHTYYLDDSSRQAFVPKLEALLLDKMNSAKTDGELLTYYRSFLSVAASSEAISFLKALSMEGPETRQLPKTGGLELHNRLSKILRPKDRFEIASKMIVIGENDAAELLSSLEKSNTDDASKRDAYAAKAGFATVENKKQYFDDFINNKEISESWVEAAFDSWNEPAQEKLTLPYLERALKELPNLKRDRKIFFVNGWLGAFIGGQRSREALIIVNKFLRDNPKLDDDLRRKILERVDGLERAVQIRGAYPKK